MESDPFWDAPLGGEGEPAPIVSDVQEKKLRLEEEIELVEAFLRQKEIVLLHDFLDKEIEDCINFLTMCCPSDFGELSAMLAAKGKLQGLRSVRTLHKDRLDSLKHQLKELEEMK